MREENDFDLSQYVTQGIKPDMGESKAVIDQDRETAIKRRILKMADGYPSPNSYTEEGRLK